MSPNKTYMVVVLRFKGEGEKAEKEVLTFTKGSPEILKSKIKYQFSDEEGNTENFNED